MADMRKYAGGGPEMQSESMMNDGYGTPIHRVTPTPEEARRAQEAARRAQAIAERVAGGWCGTDEDLHRGAREEARRPIGMEEHEDRLRGYSMSLHGAAAREVYMREHRLHYDVGGTLVQNPLPVEEMARDSSDARSRFNGELMGNLRGAGMEQQAGCVAQMPRHPGTMFSRETILAILKGHIALATARPPEMSERDALRALITVFENLE